MSRTSRFLISLLVIGSLASAAPADVTFSWATIAIGTDISGTLYDTYELQVDTATDLIAVEMYIQSAAPAAADFYIDLGDEYLANGANAAYDTSLHFPVAMSSLGMVYVRPADDGNNAPATDIVPDDPPGPPIREQSFNNSGLIGVDGLLDISWAAADGAAGSGPLTNETVARVTVKQDLYYGSWQVCGVEKDNTTKYLASGIGPVYYDLPGDANNDAAVSAGDYASVQANFGDVGTAGWGIPGDANNDGAVSAGDYASVQANFGDTWPPEPPSEPLSVPEPTSCILLLSLAGLALIRSKGRIL